MFSINYLFYVLALAKIATASASTSKTNSHINNCEKRWNRPNKYMPETSKAILSFVHLPVPAIDSSVSSLSIHGGATPRTATSESAEPFIAEHHKSTFDASRACISTYIVRSTTSFLEHQLSDLQERRDYFFWQYRGVLNAVSTIEINVDPSKMAKVTAVAFMLSEVLFFAGSHLETLWHHALRPGLLNWFQQGVQEEGLFRMSTWKAAAQDPSILQKAWDEQFQIKQVQLLLGCAAGMVIAPGACLLGGTSVTVAGAVCKHIATPAFKRVQKIDFPLAAVLKHVDAGLESIHLAIMEIIHHPRELLRNLSAINQWLPKHVQRGLIIGAALGMISSR